VSNFARPSRTKDTALHPSHSAEFKHGSRVKPAQRTAFRSVQRGEYLLGGR